jgi:hypothetical protein
MRWIPIMSVLTLSILAGGTEPARACLGDCDEGGSVTVDELTTATSIVLGTKQREDCFAFGSFGGQADVADLLSAVRSALEGCPSYVEVERLAAARALWEAQGIDSYRMRYRRSCFCPRPNHVDIVVRDGVIESVVEVGTGELIAAPETGLWGFQTVAALFDSLEEALRSADVAQIEYDPTRGFPASASFDFVRGAVDDELGLVIENLEAIE